MINLYKLHFLSSHFSSQSNKRFFQPFSFHPFNLHIWGKTKSFLSSNFFHFYNQMNPYNLLIYKSIHIKDVKNSKMLLNKWKHKKRHYIKVVTFKKNITLSYHMLLEIASYCSLNFKTIIYIYIYIYKIHCGLTVLFFFLF